MTPHGEPTLARPTPPDLLPGQPAGQSPGQPDGASPDRPAKGAKAPRARRSAEPQPVESTGPDTATTSADPVTPAPVPAAVPADVVADAEVDVGNDGGMTTTDEGGDPKNVMTGPRTASKRRTPPKVAKATRSSKGSRATTSAEPAENEPVEPAENEPVENEPVDNAAIGNDPVDADPVDAEPALDDDEWPPPGGTQQLIGALTVLRETLATARYALPLPGADAAAQLAAGIVDQFDDYLLPRLGSLGAPVLVVVGGSTGVGKSTLVNSLVRAPVSPAGVLRPTTRAAVVVCHPTDVPWFTDRHLLPGLGRTAVTPRDGSTLRVVSAPALPPGLAFLDAPDLDSVVDANRTLARKLLAAADMWLFVTSASRYADAIPWEQLRAARWRGAAVAVVLDRVPPGGAKEILPDLGVLLAANDLDGTPVFVLPEVRLDGQGLLSERQVGALQDWFARLAGSATARASVVRHTVEGAIISSSSAVSALVDAAADQVCAVEELRSAVSLAYRVARSTVELGVTDGSLLQGEVAPRWRRLTRTEDRRAVTEIVRDWTAGLAGRTEADERLSDAIERGLVALVRSAAANAAEQATNAWRLHPAGAALLDSGHDGPVHLHTLAPRFAAATRQVVSQWRQRVLASVSGRDEALRVLIGACAESGSGGPTPVTGQDLALTDDPAVAAARGGAVALAEAARRDLLDQVGSLLDAEAARFRELLDQVGVDPSLAERLHRAAATVDAAHRGTPVNIGPIGGRGIE